MRQRLLAVAGTVADTYLQVDITAQTLALVEQADIAKTYPVSTSKFGAGNQEGSFKTPLGIHRITEKIGAGLPPGRILKSRKDTGQDWDKTVSEQNLILSRILRLEGLEPGVNSGPRIDSHQRYIYIHGTNQEHLIGTPASHGCVVMKNADILDLFDRVTEGAIVIIS